MQSGGGDIISTPSSCSDRSPSPGPLDTRTINFRFRSRFVPAEGSASDGHHPNVLRLRVRHCILDYCIQTLFRFASALVPGIRSTFPEWFLPECIVLKKQKDGWEEEFATELETYEKLQPLQGDVVPVYYGQIEYDGAPAIILSDIGGLCLATPEGTVLEPEDLRPLLHVALSSLTNLGISHDDIKLDNFRLVGDNDKVMVVDFECVTTGLSADKLALKARNNADRLTRNYKGNIECMKYDGLLPLM